MQIRRRNVSASAQFKTDACDTILGFSYFIFFSAQFLWQTHHSVGFCEWFSIVHHPSSVPPFNPFISVFCVTSIRLVCVFTFIYLFWFEGCKHIWYRFEAVRYDSNWLNPSVVQHITCHDGRAPSSLARQMYYRPANIMTSLAFVLLPLSFFSPPRVSSLPSILSYWAVLLRLKYWSLLRLTLTWQSGLLYTVPSKTSKCPIWQIHKSVLFLFSPFSFQPPFSVLWLWDSFIKSQSIIVVGE